MVSFLVVTIIILITIVVIIPILMSNAALPIIVTCIFITIFIITKSVAIFASSMMESSDNHEYV
jgi:hypothetical protein